MIVKLEVRLSFVANATDGSHYRNTRTIRNGLVGDSPSRITKSQIQEPTNQRFALDLDMDIECSFVEQGFKFLWRLLNIRFNCVGGLAED